MQFGWLVLANKKQNILDFELELEFVVGSQIYVSSSSNRAKGDNEIQCAGLAEKSYNCQERNESVKKRRNTPPGILATVCDIRYNVQGCKMRACRTNIFCKKKQVKNST